MMMKHLIGLMILGFLSSACGTMNYDEEPETDAAAVEKRSEEKKASEKRDTETTTPNHFEYSHRSKEGGALDRRLPQLSFENGEAVVSKEEWQRFLNSLSNELRREGNYNRNQMLLLGLVAGGVFGVGFQLYYRNKLLKQHRQRGVIWSAKVTAASAACGVGLAALGTYGRHFLSPARPLPLYLEVEGEDEDDEAYFEEEPQVDYDKVREEYRKLLPE